MGEERLWTKDFITITVVNLVLFLSMYLLLVTIATYTIEVYNTSTGLAGLVSSIFIIGVLLARFLSGQLMNKVGAKRTLIYGVIWFLLISFLYFLEINVYVLMLVRLLHGIGIGFATTATGTIVSQVIPANKRGQGISYFSLSVILSTAIGPLIGVFLIAQFDYMSVFVFSSLMGFLSLCLSYFVTNPAIEEVDSSSKSAVSKGTFNINNFIEKSVIPISLVTFVAAFAYSAILSFIVLYAQEINLETVGGFYFLVYAIIVMLSRPFTGKLIDIKSENVVIYPSVILFAIGFLILSLTKTSSIFLLAAVFIGLGYGNFQSTTQAISIKYTPIHRMGMANSTYFIFLDLALGTGPLILGLFHDFISLRQMYGLLAIVILFSLVIYRALYEPHLKKKLQEKQNKSEVN